MQRSQMLTAFEGFGMHCGGIFSGTFQSTTIRKEGDFVTGLVVRDVDRLSSDVGLVDLLISDIVIPATAQPCTEFPSSGR
jgi:hypothetical protein